MKEKICPSLSYFMTTDDSLEGLKNKILHETKNVASFVTIGQTLHKLYYQDKLVKNQKEFLEWTKVNLGFSKSTTYEYIISYRVYSDIVAKLPANYAPPMYQSHCQLLSKVPPEQLVDAWIEVNQTAPNGVITTAVLEAYLASRNYKSEKKVSPRKKRKPEKRRLKRKDSDTEDEEEDQLEFPTTESQDTVVAEPLELNLEFDQPIVKQEEQTPPKKRARMRIEKPKLPFDAAYVYELAQRTVTGQEFDKVCKSTAEFNALEQETWYGRIFCDLSSSLPFSTTYNDQETGIERLLSVIFTRYASKEYNEGIFIIRAEFGADWFTPILQHPICILRHIDPQKNGFNSYVAFYMGTNVLEFANCFRNVGLIPGFNSWSLSLAATKQRVEPVEQDFNSEFINEQHLDSQPMEDLSQAASVLCHMTNGLDDKD
ncbi:hypothetical protein HDV06_006999 [Boothiomyces sp. JEL0866]|nr:hypothetical protein HDV06_006999 [Boothiomyces sp. JEL0866]